MAVCELRLVWRGIPGDKARASGDEVKLVLGESCATGRSDLCCTGMLVRFGGVACAVALVSCSGAQTRSVTSAAPVSVWASAPAAVPLLGTPFDQHFRPFPNASVFSSAGTRTTVINEFRHERTVIDSSEGLHANASAWGIVSVNGGIDYTQRYATFRAYHLSRVDEIDGAAEIGAVPNGAVYYLWRVYLGHAYEEVVSGDANRFTSGVRAVFPSITGEISGFAKSQNLQSRFFGRGLVPTNGRALFANTSAEIQSSYTTDGPEVPIFVEYRQLPNTQADRTVVTWLQTLRARVRFTRVQIDKDGSWGTTVWSISAQCTVNGQSVPLQNSAVKQDERVSDGESYPLSWEAELLVVQGDEVRCGTSAHLHDEATPLQSAGEGAMEPVPVAQGVQRSGAFNAGNAKGAYRVTWAVDIR